MTALTSNEYFYTGMPEVEWLAILARDDKYASVQYCDVPIQDRRALIAVVKRLQERVTELHALGQAAANRADDAERRAGETEVGQYASPSRESCLEVALRQWLHDFGTTNELSQRTRILLGVPHPTDVCLCGRGKNFHPWRFCDEYRPAQKSPGDPVDDTPEHLRKQGYRSGKSP